MQNDVRRPVDASQMRQRNPNWRSKFAISGPPHAHRCSGGKPDEWPGLLPAESASPLKAPESPIRTSSIGAELKEHTSCARAHGDGGMAGRLANERMRSR